jgi:hypothetical protein
VDALPEFSVLEWIPTLAPDIRAELGAFPDDYVHITIAPDGETTYRPEGSALRRSLRRAADTYSDELDDEP